MKLSFFCIFTLISAIAFSAHAADFEGSLYIKDANIAPGGKTTLSLRLNNNIDINGCLFSMKLPSGISVINCNLSQKRLPEGASIYDKTIKYTFSDQVFEVSLTFDYTDENGTRESFTGNEGEIATISITADENIQLGTYPITLTKVNVNTPEPRDYLISETTFSLNVQPANYQDGYELSFAPSAIKSATSAAQTATIGVSMEAKTKIASIEFDINWSKETSLYKKNGAYQIYYDNYEPENEDMNYVLSNDEGMINGAHISFSADDVFEPSYESLLKMELRAGKGTTDGVYLVEFKNITFIDDNDNQIDVAPYSADIYLGTAKAKNTDGVVAFHGDYTDESSYGLMTAAMPSSTNANDAVTTLDLKAVVAVPEGRKITTNNPNAIIRCTKDLGLTQDNVVIGDECANLVLTDGYAFKNTEEFTANTASYSRTMTNHSWGTLCLPFAASSTNANVYTLNSVTTGADGEMKFTQAAAAAVEANTPCVIKKDADDVTFADSDVVVEATPAESKAGTGAPDWTLNGTSIDLNFTTDLSSLYFINNDQFWQASSSLHVAPFRAYFNGPAGSLQAKFRITEETNGIETIENEAEAGVIYDLQGRAVKTAQAGQVYVQGAKKFVVK